MSCFDFPGGIGTASRRGRRAPRRRAAALQLRRPRVPRPARGSTTRPGRAEQRPDTGSCIAVCATDAPLSALQLRRLALRPLLGLARAGSYALRGLGRDRARLLDRERRARSATTRLDPLFAAAYEAAHEAVYNCLVAARPAERLDGTMQDAFPLDAVRGQ